MSYPDHPYRPGRGYLCQRTKKITKFVMGAIEEINGERRAVREPNGSLRGACEHCGAESTSAGEALEALRQRRKKS